MPAHTPYDGSSRPFAIGLRPLDISSWIEMDDYFDAYRAEKERLYAEIPEKVFVAESDTVDAQQEVLDLLSAHLLTHHADHLHRIERNGLPSAPLVEASLLVQEDLILMRKSESCRRNSESHCRIFISRFRHSDPARAWRS